MLEYVCLERSEAMTNRTVSIIMGIYNCAATLGEAIASVLAQTFQDWELILCDDGSKDETYSIAKTYQEKYPDKIILLQNERNMGLNYTLNRCLQEAQGEYVARMDGDDISVPTRLEKLVKALNENSQFVVVSSSMIRFDESGEWGQNQVILFPEKKDFLKHSPFFCHAASMIRRDVFLEVDGYTVHKNLLRVEDCHLWFKIYSKGYKGMNLEEPLYKMRDDQNATSRRTVRNRLNIIYVTWIGFKMIKMPWYAYVYAIRTTLLELLKIVTPTFIYKIIHKRRNKKTQ